MQPTRIPMAAGGHNRLAFADASEGRAQASLAEPS